MKVPLAATIASTLLSTSQSAAKWNRNICPTACSDVGYSPEHWDVYTSVERLSWCNQTMLTVLNIHGNVADLSKTTRLSACAISSSLDPVPAFKASNESHAARKVHLAKRRSSARMAETSPMSLPMNNATAKVEVQTLTSKASGREHAPNVMRAAQAAAQYVHQGGSSKETIVFAYHNGSTVGLYSGGKLKNSAVLDLLDQLIKTVSLPATSTVPAKTAIQVCGQGRSGDYSAGIVSIAADVASGRDSLSFAQDAVAAWQSASCVSLGDATTSKHQALVQQVQESPGLQPNVTRGLVAPRTDMCEIRSVVSGDTCSILASKCGITPYEFTQYNPSATECSTLVVGEWVCCSAGSFPDFAPIPYANGTCADYTVQPGDSCSFLAGFFTITVDDINNFNKDTWGWTGCNDLLAYETICLSSGDPPLPAPIANAVCGPQVPGTSTTTTTASSLASLNPCPLNACCDIWGQCGITSDFCTASESATGAPGTAAPNQNGCISNCGTDIVNNSAAPPVTYNVGYFEAFNLERSCLNMGADEIPSGYSHVHFAFATITPGFQIDISDSADQWELFVQQTGFKRIISIGGWAFSTDPSTYNIFREAMSDANRATLIASIVNFVTAWGVDGVDIDWEYPGEPDIPGIPAGSADDGLNYAITLIELKAALPADVTVSIAAPASFWYLRGFPIGLMSDFVDYIIYMTYDLHGQWDYNRPFDDPGCPSPLGNCLRSHVNFTETYQALSLITKAGVPASKVVVGVTSYARSFEMEDPSCTGPNCLFTGPASGATPGQCTNTAGYISNAELAAIIADSSTSSQHFQDNSFSDILVWGSNWAAYMSDSTKQTRKEIYAALNFGGSTEWAIDLESFVADFDGQEKVYYSEESDWATHPCNDPAVNNSLSDGGPRWNAAGCDAAWADFLTSWNGNPHSSSFSNELSNYFHGPPNWDCGVISALDSSCGDTTQCNNVDKFPPAAQFIMDSLALIQQLYSQLYAGIAAARDDIAALMSTFIDTFAPPTNDSTEWLDLLLNIIGLAFSVAVVPMLDIMLSPVLSELALEVTKNAVVSSVGYGVNIATTLIELDLTQTNSGEVHDNTDSVEVMLSNITSVWEETVVNIDKMVFSGDASDVATLWNMIDEGQFIEPNIAPLPATTGQIYMENALLGVLIPYAWSLKDEYPFLMDTGMACGTVLTSSQLDDMWLTAAVVKAATVCLSGTMYFLLSPTGNDAVCGPANRNGPNCVHNSFSTPSGLESLLSDNVWGSLTVAKLASSAFQAYQANGNKNGWSPPDVNTTAGLQSVIDAMRANPNDLPAGMVQLPICNSSLAIQNWDNAGTPGSSEKPNFPCNPTTILDNDAVMLPAAARIAAARNATGRV